jgi:hypothetical protein
VQIFKSPSASIQGAQCLRPLLSSLSPLRLSQIDATSYLNGVSTSRESGNIRSQHRCIQSSKASPGRRTRPRTGPPSEPSPKHHYTELHTFKLPPTSAIPQMMHRQPTAPRPYKVEKESLKPGGMEDRGVVARAWLLPPSVPPIEGGGLDILAALYITNSCDLPRPDLHRLSPRLRLSFRLFRS